MYKLSLGGSSFAWFALGFVLYKSLETPYGFVAMIICVAQALIKFMLLAEEISIDLYEQQSNQKPKRKKKPSQKEVVKRMLLHTCLYLLVVALVTSILYVNGVRYFKEIGLSLAFVAALLGLKGV